MTTLKDGHSGAIIGSLERELQYHYLLLGVRGHDVESLFPSLFRTLIRRS